ncbi:hypothetical protein V8E52_002190 [Russula decolorans]|jgi:hypothetical protein
MFPRPRIVQSELLSAALLLFCRVPLIPGRGAPLVPFHPRQSRQYRHHHLTLYSRLLARVSTSGCRSSFTLAQRQAYLLYARAPANNSPRADSFPKSRKIASTPLPLPTHCPPSCEMYAICLIIIFFSSPQDVMCDSRRRECTHTTGTLSSWPMKMLALLLSSSRVRRLASVLVGVSV